MTRAKIKIHKGDTVVIRAGKDKGKVGEVVQVLPEAGRLVVRGVNIVTRHVKPSATSAGGIVREERSIHISNVAFYHQGKMVRLGYKIEQGRKVRIVKQTGEEL